MSTTSFRITKDERFFYSSSFRQLSSIQSRQVGLVVGAAVADAAARAFDHFDDAPAIAAFEASDGELAFAPHSFSLVPHTGSLAHHSFSYESFLSVVASLAEGRGVLDADAAQARLLSVAGAHSEMHATHHAQLLHACCVLTALPLAYPFCDDEPLRELARPLLDVLVQETPADAALGQSAHAEHAAVVVDSALSWLGIPMRFLQRNPDAVKNAAFVARPAAALIFPLDCRSYLPEAAHVRLRAAAPVATLPPWSRATPEAEVLRSACSIARSAADFAGGVRQAIRMGGPTCQRALLVGAMLGAKLGVRSVPQEWLQATRDHQAVVPMAVECSQWAWNPLGS